MRDKKNKNYFKEWKKKRKKKEKKTKKRHPSAQFLYMNKFEIFFRPQNLIQVVTRFKKSKNYWHLLPYTPQVPVRSDMFGNLFGVDKTCKPAPSLGCKFPFKYEGKPCDGPKCCNLDDDPNGAWCSTKNDKDGNFIRGSNNYEFCGCWWRSIVKYSRYSRLMACDALNKDLNPRRSIKWWKLTSRLQALCVIYFY